MATGPTPPDPAFGWRDLCTTRRDDPRTDFHAGTAHWKASTERGSQRQSGCPIHGLDCENKKRVQLRLTCSCAFWRLDPAIFLFCCRQRPGILSAHEEIRFFEEKT